MRKNMKHSRKFIGSKSKLFGNYEEEEKEKEEKVDASTRQYMEFEKDRQEDKFSKQTQKLRNGVEDLKEISLNIGNIISEDNVILEGMKSDMNKTQYDLNKTRGGLKDLMKTKSTRHMCILIIFILVVFFVIYFLIKYAWYK